MIRIPALIRCTTLLAIAVAMIGAAFSAEPQNASASRIEVTWTDPADFSEANLYPGTGLGRESPDEWLGELANHLRYRAERVLAPGETLHVTFTNVQRAGTYQPWRGPQWYDVRIIKAIYPPEINLTFTADRCERPRRARRHARLARSVVFAARHSQRDRSAAVREADAR